MINRGNPLIQHRKAVQTNRTTSVFVAGQIATFARPLEGGEVRPLLPELWEIDDPLPRFFTGLLNLTSWAQPTAAPTHRIFVAADQFDEWIVRLRPNRVLSARELAGIGDPITRAERRIRARAGPSDVVTADLDAAADHPHAADRRDIEPGAGPALLTIEQVCEMVGLSRSTIYDWKREGCFSEALNLGGMVRWSNADVVAWIREQEAARHENG